MLTILLRTVIIYCILLTVLRVMGKRQIGQLEVSDLVTTLMLSEIATLPMENPQIPLLFAVIPIVALLVFEVVSSVIAKRSPRFRRAVNSTPSVLIRRGVIMQAEMKRSRISLEELVSEVRQNGVADISDVYYAILEANGSLTVIPRYGASPLTRDALSGDCGECGIAHIVVSEGRINDHALKDLNIAPDVIERELCRCGVLLRDVYLMTCNDELKFRLTKKEGNA